MTARLFELGVASPICAKPSQHFEDSFLSSAAMRRETHGRICLHAFVSVDFTKLNGMPRRVIRVDCTSSIQ